MPVSHEIFETCKDTRRSKTTYFCELKFSHTVIPIFRTKWNLRPSEGAQTLEKNQCERLPYFMCAFDQTAPTSQRYQACGSWLKKPGSLYPTRFSTCGSHRTLPRRGSEVSAMRRPKCLSAKVGRSSSVISPPRANHSVSSRRC